MGKNHFDTYVTLDTNTPTLRTKRIKSMTR